MSTPNPDLAEHLCHIQMFLHHSRSYQVSTYAASPCNSCKGIITGALPIPTGDALMNDIRSPTRMISTLYTSPTLREEWGLPLHLRGQMSSHLRILSRHGISMQTFPICDPSVSLLPQNRASTHLLILRRTTVRELQCA
ncbi:hypothetical protein HPB50_006653 [Hyalomma asiaticum]|uniref:Uncharacterized protein n=1 Tax=Hyalomma asiaticum TaxID=266040 RepID=A0ACB7STZ2_HYAAI|nr:hypothetical protein HPB50_006653 [Hyalomma asiaticum]